MYQHVSCFYKIIHKVPKVRSALCAASQLPGEGPTDEEDAPAPDVNQNMMMMIIHSGWSLTYL